ncbi:putative COX1/OXI3 intron 2 protein [Spatholobus suberectus]|nr:putative COX1/OXI3 intron 2 protein [Spatholobus suberectus]
MGVIHESLNLLDVVNWFEHLCLEEAMGSVISVAVGLVGEIVTGLVEGTVMMVGVSEGVMTGVGGVGFVGKTVVGELFVSCRVLLMWILFEETKFSTRNFTRFIHVRHFAAQDSNCIMNNSDALCKSCKGQTEHVRDKTVLGLELLPNRLAKLAKLITVFGTFGSCSIPADAVPDSAVFEAFAWYHFHASKCIL